MPKRPIYLQPPDNPYRRNRRDFEFLCNYWNRLLTANQNHDIRLPELLRANHLIRHLSSLPSNHGLRVNVSFTILDDNDRSEPQDMYTEMYPLNNTFPFCIEAHNGFSPRRSSCNTNTARYNNLLRNHVRQINENYATIERELARGRLSVPLVERDRFTRCQREERENTLYNQRAATYNWNKYPVGNRAYSARIPSGIREKYVNSQENNNCSVCASFQHKNTACSVNQQPVRQKENSPKAMQNCVGTALDENNNIMIKRHSRSKQSMEECQSVDKIINDTAKVSHSTESPKVKFNNDGVAINKNDERSIGPRPIDCQANVPLELSIATDQSQQGRGNKRKLDDLEDRSSTTELDLRISSQRNQRETIKGIESRVKDAPTILTLEETVENEIKNGRTTMEDKLFSTKHVSSPKYLNFLKMFRKEEAKEIHSNPSSRRNDEEKLQRRKVSRTERNVYDRANSRIEKRTPTPRSTVHTTYNPMMHSSATDSILDTNGLTIQLLRLAVLLHAPVLMPVLNSLIAQQNQQTPVSSSSFETFNDLFTQIFRLLGQQSISNLPVVSLESDNEGASSLTAETNAESSQTRNEQKEKDISIATKESFSLKQESISAGTSGWNSNNRVQHRKKKDRKWRLISMLNDYDVRLDRNFFTIEDFRKFEKFLRIAKKRSEDVRSLSTKSENENVMKEFFRNWLHRLLQQFNSASSNLSVNAQKTKYSKESLRNTGSSLEEVKGQENTDRLIVEESPYFSKDGRNIFTEYEEEDSDDQKSLTSATSTEYSTTSLQLKQSDARKTESQNEKLHD